MDREPFLDERFDEADRLQEEAKALVELFHRNHDVPVLRDAVDMLIDACEYGNRRHPLLRLILQDLDRASSEYFEYTGEHPGLDTIINVLRASGQQFPKDNLDRAWYLNTLGMAHADRYRILNRPEDIDEAIRLTQLAVDHRPLHVQHKKMVINLVTQRHLRYKSLGRPEDLEYAVTIVRAAVLDCLQDDSARKQLLTAASIVLLEDFRRTSKQEQLLDAITCSEEAIDATENEDPELSYLEHDFSFLLLEKYHAYNDPDDLDRAIDMMNDSILRARSDDPFKPIAKYGLASLLHIRSERNGNDADLTLATRLGEEALYLLEDDNYRRSHCLGMLASCHGTIWRRRGDPFLLGLAIELATECVETIKTKDWTRASALNTLGWWLGQRFESLGAMDDLDKAIEVSEKAVSLGKVSSGHSNNTALFFNLGNLLVKRWRRTKEEIDLDRAIDLAEEGLKEIPATHSERPSCLARQCDWLFLRADYRQSKVDKDNAAKIAAEALLTTPKDAPEKAYLLSVLTRQATSGASPEAINDAIWLGEEALEDTPTGHPERAIRLQNLGIFHEIHHRREFNADHLEKALSYYTQSWQCKNGHVVIRLQSSVKRAKMLADLGRWHEADDVLDEAVKTIPNTSSRALSNTDKQHILAELSGLACIAAAVPLAAGLSAYKALSQLELARGVIASHLMDMRTNLSLVKAQSPALAAKFERLKAELDIALPSVSGFAGSESMYNSRVSKRAKAEEEFKHVVSEIQGLEGLSNFLAPPSEGELQQAAGKGPIVVINISTYRCDAFLIVQKKPVQVVPLEITESDVLRMSKKLGTIQRSMTEVLEWLWEKIANPILTELGFTAPPVNDDWPCIWWIPTGPLANFPLHAAGIHTVGSRDTVLDRAISSYTSSIKSLRHGRENQAMSSRTSNAETSPSSESEAKNPKLSAILVAMEKTPKGPGLRLRSLRFARQEVKILRDLCPSMDLHPLEPERRRESVLSSIKTCRVFHFAGHGVSDPTEPAQGSLLLEDWVQSRLTVAHFRDLHLDSGGSPPFLAYLSACSTGSTAGKLVDESINLVSACHLAGFSHVIGTLWKVSDKLCVEVARRVYERCRDEGLVDEAVSRGLHFALRELRDIAVRDQYHGRRDKESGSESGSEISGSLDIDGRDIGGLQNSSHHFFWVPYVHFGG
jgi:CHAT domain-containing protein/tetratricopeptide (TPR) repeat protein